MDTKTQTVSSLTKEFQTPIGSGTVDDTAQKGMSEHSSWFSTHGLTVSLQGNLILKNIDLVVAKGEFLSLLGPSGCGKTTFLKTIAGLLVPDSGDVNLGGASLNSVPPQQRGTVVVFQDMRLFPHMNVIDNVAFGLKMQGRRIAARHDAAHDLLDKVGLSDFGKRHVRELSGGQQQRVALARALAIKPRLLLLDEPFSSLDTNLRQRMREMVRALHDSLSLTTVLVTHDHAEALLLSDRIAMMFEGELVQIDSPRILLEQPATPEVAEYFSELNLINERIQDIFATPETTPRIPSKPL
jgi:ABC-type Fe3+/spermidine/putrescine transport system ATPase subunit